MRMSKGFFINEGRMYASKTKSMNSLKHLPANRFSSIACPSPTLNPINKSFNLQGLCESNFRKLFQLAPHLLNIECDTTAKANGGPELLVRILDRQRYTVTLILTHHFALEREANKEPELEIRVYLDARSAEVIGRIPRGDSAGRMNHRPSPETVLDDKWTVNYFFEKWLNHCLGQGYLFDRSKNVEMAV